MEVEVTKMSSKGQIVIPMKVRKRLNAKEGTLFAVVGTEDGALIKKVHTPSPEEVWAHIDAMAREIAPALKKKGWTEEKVIAAALKAGGRNRESRS